MPYYTRAQCVTKIAELQTKLDAAMSAESYGIGERNLRRNTAAIQREMEKWESRLEMIDRYSDGFANKVKFVRPA